MIALAAIIAALVVDAATKESGQLAYELKRDTGLPWGQLREPTGLKVPQGAAQKYARRHGLPWPLETVRVFSCKGAEAYDLRATTNLSWREIARQVGGDQYADVYAITAARKHAEKTSQVWPVPRPETPHEGPGRAWKAGVPAGVPEGQPYRIWALGEDEDEDLGD